MPKRVQLSRRAGWRMPADTVKVDRSTRWGNPFKPAERTPEAMARSVEQFRRSLKADPILQAEVRGALRGKNLACWCPLGGPCHAEVLLACANGGTW